MNTSFWLSGFLILNAAIFQITGANDDIDAVMKEFNSRATTVITLSRIYSKYEDAVESGDKRESELVLEAFFDKFDNEFDDSDQWLFSALVQNDGLVKHALVTTKYFYSKMETFLNASGKIIQSAIFIHIRYLTIRGNLTDAKKVEDFQASATKQLDDLTDSTLRFLREEAWKNQFKFDIVETIRNHRTSSDVHVIIKDMLSEKYPFRAWLVIRTSTSIKRYLCHSGLYYEGDVTQGKEKVKIQVFQTKGGDNYFHQDYAGEVLNNIPNSKKYWTCKDRMETIYEESKYKCSSKKLALFSVFKVKTGIHLNKIIGIKDRNFMFTKRVNRSAWYFFCRHLYEIVLFG